MQDSGSHSRLSRLASCSSEPEKKETDKCRKSPVNAKMAHFLNCGLREY